MKKIKFFLVLLTIIFWVVILNSAAGIIVDDHSITSDKKSKKKIDYINPFIGTSGDHGQTDPSANVPFGMIKPGPDTEPGNHSGYDYRSEHLLGFSQTRFSGVGCEGIGGNLRILPFINTDEEYAEMDKRSEVASAGYYTISLKDGIRAEVTAGRTTAFYRFIYPERKRDGISIDFKSTFSEFVDENHVLNKNEIQGWIKCKCNCKTGMYKIYYYLKLDKVPEDSRIENGKLKLIFNSKKGETVNLKTALSTVSEDGAKNNMEEETVSKSFQQLKSEAEEKWEKLCETVKVETNDESLKTLFYTHLYHAVQTPFSILDYSGKYRGSNDKIYKSADNNSYYYGWSVWDTFRTKLPMLSVLFPGIYTELMSSMLKMYEHGKSDNPKMTESFLTIRNEHTIPVILDAYRKNLVKEPLEHFLPRFAEEADSLILDSPDKILEGCYDFWGVAELAKEFSEKNMEEKYRLKSFSYRNVWKEKFFLMNKNSDIMHGDDLYEGTLWQYRWFVPYDMDWVVYTVGSKEKLAEQLDYFFDNNLFNIGNQPDIQVPFLYYYLGQPWKTEKLVRKLLLEPTVNYYGTHKKWNKPYIGKIFKDDPEGFLTEMDDDAGTMSGWFIFASIGLYPVCVGTPDFWILPSVFNSVAINLPGNKIFTIKNTRSTKKDIYIQKILLNGKVLNRSYLNYSEIMNGGLLELYLSSDPELK